MNGHQFSHSWGHQNSSYSANTQTGLSYQQSVVSQPYTLEEQDQGRISWEKQGYSSQAPTRYFGQVLPTIPYVQPFDYSQSIPVTMATVTPAAVFGDLAPAEGSYTNTMSSTPDVSRGPTPDRRSDDILCQILVDSGLWAERNESESHIQDGSQSPPSPTLPTLPTGRQSSHGKVQKRTRIAQACEPCRKRKHKCSGSIDGKKCGRCQSKKLSCIFAPTAAQAEVSPVGVKKQRTSSQSGPKPTPMFIAEPTFDGKLESDNQLQLQLDGGVTSQYSPLIPGNMPYGYGSSLNLSSSSSIQFSPPANQYTVDRNTSSLNALGISSLDTMPFNPTTSSYPLSSSINTNVAGDYSFYSNQQSLQMNTLPQYEYYPTPNPEPHYEMPKVQGGYAGHYGYNNFAQVDGMLPMQRIDSSSNGSYTSTPVSSDAIISPWDQPLNLPVDPSYFQTHSQPF